MIRFDKRKKFIDGSFHRRIASISKCISTKRLYFLHELIQSIGVARCQYYVESLIGKMVSHGVSEPRTDANY